MKSWLEPLGYYYPGNLSGPWQGRYTLTVAGVRLSRVLQVQLEYPSKLSALLDSRLATAALQIAPNVDAGRMGLDGVRRPASTSTYSSLCPSQEFGIRRTKYVRYDSNLFVPARPALAHR